MGITAIISAAAAVGGVGLGIKGTIDQHAAAKQAASFNQQEIQQQAAQQAEQKKLADLQAQRYQMQVIRQQNTARSLALSNATTSGAQYGSGLAGGYGQISGSSNNALLAGFQNQGISNSLYGISQNMSGIQSRQAGANSAYYAGAGLTSLGGELISAMGPIGRLGSALGGSNLFKDTSYRNNYVD